MTHEEVLQKMGESLKKVRPETDLSKADESTRLTEDLGMDSLSMLLFALQSEKDFGITLKMQEPPRLKQSETYADILKESCNIWENKRNRIKRNGLSGK